MGDAMRAKANGIEIEFESSGDVAHPAVLLISGLGAQLVRWPRPLIEGLVEGGFRVIRFDNRDCGMSTSIDDGGAPALDAIVSGRQAPPYRLDDMALDAIGLMDWLGVEQAHIIGTSMGGMIGQLMAADYPSRVLSLTCIMSTTGHADLSPSDPQLFEKLTRPRPDPSENFSDYLDYEVWRSGLIASPGFPTAAEEYRDRAQLEFERGFNPDGATRQMAAIFSSPDRRQKLSAVAVPTLAFHGLDDPLIPPDGGEDIARSVPAARLVLVPGLGHEIPDRVVPRFLGAFLDLVGQR